jgi:hypothetical protein
MRIADVAITSRRRMGDAWGEMSCSDLSFWARLESKIALIRFLTGLGIMLVVLCRNDL